MTLIVCSRSCKRASPRPSCTQVALLRLFSQLGGCLYNMLGMLSCGPVRSRSPFGSRSTCSLVRRLCLRFDISPASLAAIVFFWFGHPLVCGGRFESCTPHSSTISGQENVSPAAIQRLAAAFPHLELLAQEDIPATLPVDDACLESPENQELEDRASKSPQHAYGKDAQTVNIFQIPCNTLGRWLNIGIQIYGLAFGLKPRPLQGNFGG